LQSTSANHLINPDGLESEGGICCLAHLTSYVTEKNHPHPDKQMLPRSKAKKHNLLGCPHIQQLLRSGHYELYLSALRRNLYLKSAARHTNIPVFSTEIVTRPWP